MHQEPAGGKKVKVWRYDCPYCGGEKAVDIVYGYPDPETFQMWKDKKIDLGGCIVCKKMPNRSCPECHKKWSATKGEGNIYEEEYIMPPLPPVLPPEPNEEIPF